VLATAVLGLAGALSVSSSQSRAMEADTTALALARQLMEEALARPFDAPATNDHAGWKAGNRDKSSYDDVADYDGYTDVTVAPSTGHSLGTISSAKINFHRAVTFTRRTSAGGGAPAASGDFGLISVTVTPEAAGTEPITLHRLVCRVPVVR
jgi:hypothetical protein